MRIAFVFCAGLALMTGAAACQTVPKSLPPVAPIACPPSVTAPLASQPLVPEQSAQMAFIDAPDSLSGAESYLAYVEALARWGRDGWSRVATAKAYCEGVR